MFGISKINLDISLLWNAVMEADKVARTAVRDGDVISKSNKEAHKKIEEQGEAIMAIAKYLGVTFENKYVPDPCFLPRNPPMVRTVVCKPLPDKSTKESV